ncbi:hypothetical protein FHV99_004611 [Ochrobactrum sp. P20RRXII]|nr:hypothetical protein [Ochrobactrum sp. P20RRXII]NIH77359.1 hypothetical protein [Ochrobactrum sp. P20RRXII]
MTNTISEDMLIAGCEAYDRVAATKHELSYSTRIAMRAALGAALTAAFRNLPDAEKLITVGVQHQRSVDGKWHYGEAAYANQQERELVTRENALHWACKTITEQVLMQVERIDTLEKFKANAVDSLRLDNEYFDKSQQQIKDLEAEVATLKAEIKRISETDIDFNINNHVRVRLTDDGKAILAAQYESLRTSFPKLPPHAPKQEDEDGYASFQMWDLMQSFGSHIHLGSTRLPFQTSIRFENPLRSTVSKGADDAVS